MRSPDLAADSQPGLEAIEKLEPQIDPDKLCN
jgi:hypothetical protein